MPKIISRSFPQPHLFTAFAFLLFVHCARTYPFTGSEEYSSEDDDSGSIETPEDESTSASKTKDSWSAEESEIKTSELSTEAPWAEGDDVRKIDFSLSEDEPPKQNTFALLEQVFDNAGQFSNKLDRAAKIVGRKITDWSQRINTYRGLIFGQGGNNNNILNNGNGNNWDNYNGGGGVYASNYQTNNMGGGGSIKSAYDTVCPFVKEIYGVLVKVFAYTNQLASRFLVASKFVVRNLLAPQKQPTQRRPGPGQTDSHSARLEPIESGRVKGQPRRRNRPRRPYTKSVKGRGRAHVAAGPQYARTTKSKNFETPAHTVVSGAKAN